MHFDKFNKWMGMFANLGVLVGIVFLVIEIQQNTTATEAAMRASINAKDIAFLSLSIDQKVLARASSKIYNDEPLSPLEESQLSHQQYINFIIFEHSYDQFQKGIINVEEWGRHERIARDLMQNFEPARKMWAQVSNGYSENFTGLINGMINELDEEATN